jgi:hypothetical protein
MAFEKVRCVPFTPICLLQSHSLRLGQSVLLLHYQSLKDLNENRLSKFEFALYVQKLLEFFLTDDIAFNYVEHFYTSDRFRPGYLPYR